MSDHFDITLERRLESSADSVGDVPTGVRRIELITGSERRRRWSEDDKARIVVESFAPGANVSEVARRNGLSPQQLFAWRREARALFGVGGDTAVAAAAPTLSQKASQARPLAIDDHTAAFAPVVVAASSLSSPPPSPPPPPRPGTIEITIGDAVVRVSGQVDIALLVAALSVVRRAS